MASYMDLYKQLQGGGLDSNLGVQLMHNAVVPPIEKGGMGKGIHEYLAAGSSAAQRQQTMNAITTLLPYKTQLEVARINALAQLGARDNELEMQRRGFVADDYKTKQQYYKQFGI